MWVETVRDGLGRAIGVLTRLVLGSRVLRAGMRIIPTPLRREIPRLGRRLRRMELESGPYPGTPHQIAPSDLPAGAIPYGYEIGERAGIGIFLVDQRRPTRIPRKVNGIKLRKFPSGPGLSYPKNQGADPEIDTDRFRRMVQRVEVINAGACTWPDPQTRIRLLTAAAACGTPIIFEPDHNSEDLHHRVQGPEQMLRTASGGHSVKDLLADHETRDLVAWRQWRGVRPDVAPVPVTIVIATRRPDMLTRWSPQIRAQTHRPLSICVALHGEDWGEITNAEITAHLGEIPVHITRCPQDWVLGQVLNAATNNAGGDLIVKWDDDDLYSTEHVADLVRTWDTTGAMLVGKACEYVYLKGSDVTVRRIQAARESVSRTMAGGTLCISRADLEQLGGWDPIPSGVDVGLISRVQAAGGLAYRSMGFGYMMIREPSGQGHTWGVQDEHFLTPATPRRMGLAVDWAQIDAPAEILNELGASAGETH